MTPLPMSMDRSCYGQGTHSILPKGPVTQNQQMNHHGQHGLMQPLTDFQPPQGGERVKLLLITVPA